MELERGDYFVVLRGRELKPDMEVPTDCGNMATLPAQYDRGWDGVVAEVLVAETHSSLIAAKVIYPAQNVGQTISMNIDGMELMTVSKAYAEALQQGTQYADVAYIKEQMMQMQLAQMGGYCIPQQKNPHR